MYAAIRPLVLSITLCLTLAATAQEDHPGQRATIRNFYDGYNMQDFELVRDQFGGILKAVFTKAIVQGMFGNQYAMYGKATIVDIRFPSESSAAIDVIYERDPTEKRTMKLVFTKKFKITGMGNPVAKPNYEKLPAATLTGEEKAVVFARIDSLARIKHDQGNFNGSLIAIRDGEVVYKGCFGYSDKSEGAMLNDSSVFELASVSKQFTAMGIMILATQGRLRYDDDISKYIPGLPYKDITIRHLLTHTSGLPDYMELFAKHWPDQSKIAGNQDVVALMIRHKPKKLFKPGTKFEYSNTGYAFLSLIIENASGKTFGEFMHDEIFEPLGMKHTRIYNTRRSGEFIPNYAYGHVYSDSLKTYLLPDSVPGYEYVRMLDGITGDGTVNSTILDMVKWVEGLRNESLVPDSVLKQAFEPYKLKKGEESAYGFGWMLYGGEKLESVAEHSGGWPGYYTDIIHFTERRIDVIILSNNEYMNIQPFAIRVARIVHAGK